MSAPARTGPPAAESDAAVVAGSMAQPEWFAVLFDRHSDEIFRYAARRLGAPAAEDVVAEAFLIAFRKRGSYDTARPDARPWLYGIATHLVREHRRAEVRRHRTVARAGTRDAVESFDQRSADRVSAAGLQPRLAKVLAGLSAVDRDLLLLIAWADLSYEETARALDIPVGTVRSRLHRIRKKVRRQFGDADPLAMNEEPQA